MAHTMHCKSCSLPQLFLAHIRHNGNVCSIRSSIAKPKFTQALELKYPHHQHAKARSFLPGSSVQACIDVYSGRMQGDFQIGKGSKCTDSSSAVNFRFSRPRVLRLAAMKTEHGGPVDVLDGLEKERQNFVDHFKQFAQVVARDDPDAAANAWKELGKVPLINEIEEAAKDFDDLKQELQELYITVEQMIEEGDEETARALIEANYEALSEQLDQGIKGVEQAAMLDILAQLCMSLQDFGNAEEMLEQMKDILNVVEDHEPLFDIILEHMASMYSVLGSPKEALALYTRSLEIQEGLLGKDSPLLVKTLLGQAATYSDIEERGKSIEIYQHVLAILESSRGTNSDELALPLSHLGHTLLEDDRMDEAEVYMYRALKLAESTDVKDDGRVGVTTCALARVKCAKGEFDKAVELYQNGLHILRNSSNLSQSDPLMDSVRTEVAEFLNLIGRDSEAQELWKENLSEKEKLVGSSSPELVVPLQNLATSYAHDGKFDKCEPLLRRSLQLVTASLGPTAPQVSVPLEFLATTLHHLGREREAEPLARRALSIRETNFGMDDPIVGEACNLLASILHSQGREEESLHLMWRVLHIKEKDLGKDNPELLLTLQLLIELLENTGRTTDTFPLIERFKKLYVQAQKADG